MSKVDGKLYAWYNQKIVNLKPVKTIDVPDETFVKFGATMKILNQKFVENGAMLMNNESFNVIVKWIKEVEYKRSKNRAEYKLEKSYKEQIFKNKKLSKSIEEKRQLLYDLVNKIDRLENAVNTFKDNLS